MTTNFRSQSFLASCKRRGFCPSCGARRMAESAALLVDDVLKGYPVRQWVLSLPIPLRLLLARYPSELGEVSGIIHAPYLRTLSIKQALQLNKPRQVLLRLFNALAVR
jgi:hypothetical protein